MRSFARARDAEGSTTKVPRGKSRALPIDFEEDDVSTTAKRPRRAAAVRAQAVVASASGAPSPASSGSTSSLSRRLSNSSQVSNHPSPTTSFRSNSPPAYAHSASVFAHSPLNEQHPASPATATSQLPPPTSHLHSSSQPNSTSCGFCSTTTECLCAEIGYQYASASTTPSNPHLASAAPAWQSPSVNHADSVITNETTYEPAVPLRLSSNRSKVQSVWRIDPPQQVRSKLDTVVAVAEKVFCSGDPSNCPACSDDP